MRDRAAFQPTMLLERGITLLAGLFMLMAISLLALVASNSMILQRHMAGNFSDGQRALQAAAYAALDAHKRVFGMAHGTRLGACRQNCFPAPWDSLIRQPSEFPAYPEFENASWWQSRALEAGADFAGVSEPAWSLSGEPPRFLIEELYFDDQPKAPAQANPPELDGVGYYRILARGVGQSRNSVAVSEAIIARPWLSGNPADITIPDGADFCAHFERWYDCGLLAWRQRR